MDPTDVNHIIAQVIELYESFPLNGKPKVSEFSVLAAIVLEVPNYRQKFQVIVVATGTKCIGRDQDNSLGHLLSDSHAEVIAKRSLQRYLLKFAQSKSDNLSNPIEFSHKQGKYQLKSGYKFHLLVSDSPCGDSSIYARASGINFTGAKPISLMTPTSSSSTSECNHQACRESTQVTGILRTKSGRSTIEEKNRTTSMSCSDKISRWQYLGCQGALLANYMEPIYFSSLIVGQDMLSSKESQHEALERAFHTRMYGFESCHMLSVSIADLSAYKYGKCQQEMHHKAELQRYSESDTDMMKKRQPTPPKPCGTSINWIADAIGVDERAVDAFEVNRKRYKPWKSGSIEVTQAHLGVVHGANKRCVGSFESSSRLCRREMLALCNMLQCHIHTTGSISDLNSLESAQIESKLVAPSSYHALKRGSAEYHAKRLEFLSYAPFNSWVCDEDADFAIGSDSASSSAKRQR